MNYVSGGQTKVNNDSVGFWYHEDTQSLVIGFRGTDIADPERYLGFIPENFKERLDQTMEEMNPFDDKLTYNTTCNCTQPIRCKPEESYEDVLVKTNQSFCTFGFFHTGFDYNLYGRERQTFDYALEGGKYRCLPNSDCNADQNILNGALKGGIENDPKHVEVSNWALSRLMDQRLKPMRECQRIIFAGHSLGGSLAFFTYLMAQNRFPSEKLFFAGFNSGSLDNFNKFAMPLDNWKSRCIAHRIRKDIVSFKYGDQIPTIIYKRFDMDDNEEPISQLSGPLIHGLKAFKCSNYNVISRANFGPSREQRTSLSRTSPRGSLSRGPTTSLSLRRSPRFSRPINSLLRLFSR
jgi:hypothetical protein